MTLRLSLVALMLVLAALPAMTSQYQPDDSPDWAGYETRSDLAQDGDLMAAQRVLRFVQVSDAHILDDDAPEPLRVQPLDALGEPFTSAQRPQEEYTDEVLDATIRAINALHAEDPLDFVMNTGDTIDNQLENELMRFIDNWEGTFTEVGPFSGFACAPDGQSESVDDDSQDVTQQCTHLPETMRSHTALAPGLPWFTAFGNHDGLIQGNMPRQPGFQEVAAEYGRYFIDQDQFIDMHFSQHARCVDGKGGGSIRDDFGHGYGFAGKRLCDDDGDNDGYYAFGSRGVRFIVLDTVNDDFVTGNEHLAGLFHPQATLGHDVIGGYAEGAIDPAQFQWLQDELERSQDQLVVIFSHHTIKSMVTETGSDQCPEQGCLSDLLAAAGYPDRQQIMENLSRYPNVVAWIGGHTHKHHIEAMHTPGAPSPGFWHVETSSLIDMPQQARAIELWVTADGSKGFLRMDRIDHDFDLSRELALGDDQVDPDEYAGGVEDQDVLLWFDVPEKVSLAPQPVLPRHLRLDMMEPVRVNGSHGLVGDTIDVVLRIEDSRLGFGVAGLDVSATMERSDPVDPVGLVELGARPVHDVGNGSYRLSFTAEAAFVHFIHIDVRDPTDEYPALDRVMSIQITDPDPATKISKKSPMPWLSLVGVLAVLSLLRRPGH